MAGDMPSLPCAPSKVQYPSPIDPTFIDRLDADFIDYYNQYMAIKPVTHGVTIEDIRATPKKFTSPWCHDFSYEPFVNDMKVTSDDGHVFTVRCYTPDSRTSPFGSGPYPLHINFHGKLLPSRAAEKRSLLTIFQAAATPLVTSRAMRSFACLSEIA
jgi:hypothetical protein